MAVASSAQAASEHSAAGQAAQEFAAAKEAQESDAAAAQESAAGVAPMFRGEPGYRSGLDADTDGIASDK